jgi:hypothetical protein
MSEPLDALRAEVAAGHGLPAGAESFLTGSTLEEIEAEADALVKVLGASERQPEPEPALDPITAALRQKQQKRQQLVAAVIGRRQQPRDRQGRFTVSFDGGARQPVPPPPPTHGEYLTEAIRSHRHDIGPKFNNG